MLGLDLLLVCGSRAEPLSTSLPCPHTTALSTPHDSHSAIKASSPQPNPDTPSRGGVSQIWTQWPGTWGGATSSEVTLEGSQKVAAQGAA